MSHGRARSKGKSGASGGEGAGPAPAGAVQQSAARGPHFAAGPMIGLGATGVQRKPVIGQPGDRYEQEAESVAQRVTSGLDAPAISSIAPGSLGGGAQRAEKKPEKPAEKPVQKAEVPEKETKEEPAREEAPEETREEERGGADPDALQTAPAPPENKPEKKPEKPPEKPVQKADAKPPEKKPEARPVQKAAALPSEEMLKGKPPERPGVVGPDRDRDKAALQKAEAPKKEPEKKPQEKPVQKAAEAEKKKPEAKPVQKAEAEETTHEEPVQADSAGGATAAPAPSMAAAAEQAIGSPGAGEPLNAGTRSVLENRLDTDLSGVRVHSDSAAQQSAADLNARAFTHGSDIWLGRGESQNDLGLMAHEATHVVQQSGAVQRQVVQRADKPKGKSKNESTDPDEYKGPEGTINRRTRKASLPEMKVPTFKKKFVKAPFDLPQKTDEPRENDQRDKWEKEAKPGAGLDTKLDSKLTKGKSPRLTKDGKPIHYMKLKGDKNYVIGDKEAIRQRSLRPFWDKNGNRMFHDVDHQLELQLGGPNDTGNMWMLESKANQASGRNIKDEKNARIQKLIDAATGPVWTKRPPTVEAIRRGYTVTVEKVVGGLQPTGTPPTWSLPQIQAGEQVEALDALTKKQIEAAGLEGEPDKLAIYTSETGGGVRSANLDGKGNLKGNVRFGNLTIDTLAYTKGQGGKVGGTAFRHTKSKILQEAPLTGLEVREIDAIEYGGVITNASLRKAAKDAFKAIGLSPITMDEIELDADKGIVGRGKIKPSIPLFAKNVEIDIVIDGDNVYLSKTFDAGEFSFPGPVKVTDSSLTVNAGTQGIEVIGDIFFDVEKLGHGQLTGLGSTSKGFGLKGKFEFETDLFTPAEIEVWYRDEKFGGKGKLGVKSGKLKGVKSATVEVSVDGDVWEAKGDVEPDMRGIEKASLMVKYDPAVGIEASGNLQLATDNPLVKGGSVEASMKPRPGGTDYVVKAHGNATVGFHGLTATIDVDYDDGAFTAQGTVPFEKGMLKGSITLGVTNRAVGDDGVPSGPPTETMTPFGAGTATVKIAPWLQGTAGIKLLPNGELEVSGKIGLPSALDLFAEKKLEKRIFGINIDIPLVGVSVAGQHIGIFATIGGGLDAKASIGPGQLRDLSLEIAYNPSHEDQTTITGHAQFYVPAFAGLRLFVRGGVGVGIPVVDAKAGLEVGAELGVQGAAQADVTVEWSPAKGLALDAEGQIWAEPKFKFDVSAFVEVTADLLVTEVDLYSDKWNLASFEYGSGMRFGITFPLHYREGQPFDVALSDVQFQVPDIDPLATLSGLVERFIG